MPTTVEVSKSPYVAIEYIDPRIDAAIMSGNYELYLKLIATLDSAKKLLPLDEVSFYKLRAWAFNNLAPYGGFHEHVPLMIGVNGGIMATSILILRRSVISLGETDNPVSYVLLIISSSLASTAIIVSGIAVASAIDFIPGVSVFCNITARALNVIAKRISDAANGRVSLSDEESQEERTGRFRSFWKRITGSQQNNKLNSEEFPLVLNTDKDIILGELGNLDLLVP